MNKRRLHPLHIGRVILSLSLFAVLLLLFFRRHGISGEDASRYTALFKLQLFPAVLRIFSSAAAGAAAAAGALFAVTLLFGRAYCSSLCPVGTMEDIIFRLSPKRYKNRYSTGKKWRKFVRYSLLAAASLMSIFGISLLLGVIEPFSIFSRLIADAARPAVNRLAIAVSPLLQDRGIYLQTEPILLTLGGFAFGGGLAAAVAAVSWFRGRWFCNTLCPAGSLLSLPAAVSVWKININPDTCTTCGLCEKTCKAGCIDSKKMKVDRSDCILCFSCLSVCPVDAISYRRKRSNEKSVRVTAADVSPGEDSGYSRRDFLSLSGKALITAGVLLQVPFRRVGGQNIPPKKPLSSGTDAAVESAPIIPPGAGDIKRLTSRCTACHLCISKCPQQVLRPGKFREGVGVLEKPVLDYSRSFCEFECNVCSQVCPAGALQPLQLSEKKLTKIGTAAIENDLCVVFKDGTACGACAEICPTTSVFMVPYEGTLTAPEVTPEVCIGCGACERVCPVEGGKAIRVTALSKHGIAKVRQTLPDHAVSGEGGSAAEKRRRLIEEGVDLGEGGNPSGKNGEAGISDDEDPFAF